MSCLVRRLFLIFRCQVLEIVAFSFALHLHHFVSLLIEIMWIELQFKNKSEFSVQKKFGVLGERMECSERKNWLFFFSNNYIKLQNKI